ncbi:MAG: hypothetical protein V1837_00840 [Candidatus Woesearchaeota archaeon]
MADILQFPIYKASATLTKAGMLVQIFYPENPAFVNKKIESNANGPDIFDELSISGYSKIATAENPIRPASAGYVYMFQDEKIMFHRRDMGAKIHKMFHSVSVGYPQNKEEIFGRNALETIAKREASEECMLITRERNPWIVAPTELMEETEKQAKKYGIEMKIREIKGERIRAPDTIEAYSSQGELIYRANGIVEFGFEKETFLNLLIALQLQIDSTEIMPVDMEGKQSEDGYERFNRESYLAKMETLPRFGKPLKDFEVFQAKIEAGKLIPDIPAYKGTIFNGPEGIQVEHPHIFAPDDMLVRVLDALGAKEYEGKWMQIEKEKELELKHQ